MSRILLATIIFLGLAKFAFANEMICTAQQGHLQESLVIKFTVPLNDMGTIKNATFQYAKIWNGAFPTEDYQTGPVSGEAYWSSAGIDGEFFFELYGYGKHLKFENSQGILGDLKCAVR